MYQNQILDSIAKKTNLKHTLDKMVGLIESIFPESKASILLLDAKGLILNHFSAHSLPLKYIEAIKDLKIGPEVGSCGTAAYHNKMVICEDIANDPFWVDFKDIALDNGLKACWSFPVNNSSGEVLGTLALYYPEVRQPGKNEINLIQPFSRLTGIAIENHNVDQELIESKNIAEKANNAKSEFLSRMSHELRTPMNAILGFGQMLELNSEKNLSSIQKENINRILTAGDHLLTLINEVLDLSKIESGNFILKNENVNISLLMDMVISIIQPSADKRGIKIFSVLDHKEKNIYGDSTALKQVLLNVLSNAVKYNKENGSINLVTEITSDEKLRIKISDTGQGIPKEKMELLFQPFQRLGAEHTYIEGTGIGLSITKHLVDLMGGSISVNSSPNEGTCFTLEFQITSTFSPKEENTSSTFISTDRNLSNETLQDHNNSEFNYLNLSGIKIPSATLSKLKEAARLNNITQLRYCLNQIENNKQDLIHCLEPFLKNYNMKGIIHILNQMGHE